MQTFLVLYTFVMPSRAFLERRNALWRQLREMPPGTPKFEGALAELCALIGWNRAQVLSGLGLTRADVPEGEREP
ncbi:hypothetical protein SAMN00790413_00776 [Deinococcus hopiensis KR-140]|uniref:Uncharacterized protein n=2 Tax=Deinococcus TaxID=1298 RepID=A0A1W1VAQ7_9DEIO|nr:hypothetical protein SAMN00790413_00776 [Deinococcus hopiensis KR-140]